MSDEDAVSAARQDEDAGIIVWERVDELVQLLDHGGVEEVSRGINHGSDEDGSLATGLEVLVIRQSIALVRTQ